MKLQILELKIVSPEKVLFDGTADSITLPGTKGSFTVLPEHAPIISSLQKGEIKIMTKGDARSLEIHGGFVEVKQDVVSVCVD